MVTQVFGVEKQGDQIGRIFAFGRLFTLGMLLGT
jgi:hypothetical protein